MKCTLEAPYVYPVPNSVRTDLLLESGECLILGHRTLHKGGVCCIYREMTITHRCILQIKDTVFL